MRLVALWLSARTGMAFGLCAMMLARPAASGQDSDGDTHSVKLSEQFTFNLSQREGLREIVEKIELHDEARRRDELETANAPVFTKPLELLRYVPIKLGKSEGDDFLLPSYLTLSYRDVPTEVDLFGRR